MSFNEEQKHSDCHTDGQETQDKRAEGFYEELLSAYALVPDYVQVYRELGRLFSLLLFHGTSSLSIKFSGPFARTDYLLKENNASAAQSRLINDTRIRLRRQAELTEDEMRANCRYDLKALALFVSIVFNTPVPNALTVLFPVPRASKKVGLVLADVVRMIVDSWDEAFIYGRIDDGDTDAVKVFYAKGEGNAYDWTYLKDILHMGTQLNIVRPRIEGGVVYADLIILEPDFLVDVSSVANCFNDYGTTALNHLINKIKPFAESPAITLGNLASQFLDEEVHGGDEESSFVDSVREFYSDNPLNVLTSGVAAERDTFYKEALRQKQNISNAIRRDLPRHVAGFDRRNVILEPSFFSEMLGLQGRMDFMTLDKGMVIEQKSGRCGFPQREQDTPVHTERHYVQVLLYMLILRYNYSADYERNNGLRVFLLYSKYANSLLAEGFAPELVFRAIQVRNEIAANEVGYAKDGFRILDTLTPDSFISNAAKSVFFNRYIRPSLDAVLAPIHNGTALERSYFYRYMRFVETEHLLSKVGSQTKANSGFASTWHDSLEDKLLAGNIYIGLTLEQLPSEGRVEALELRFHESQDNDMSNFRVGDIVILYPYAAGREPDARKTMVFRCTVAVIKADTITLKLRAPQSDANVFATPEGFCWTIEHDFMEASYGSLYRGLSAFLTAPKERRDLVLMQRAPQTDTSLTLRGDYGSFNELALRVKQARDFYLIMGPPGTGKTSYGLLTTLREELLEAGTSVLLLSFTNRAVDEICSKLVADGIDFIRLGSELSCADEYRSYLLSAKADLCPRLSDFNEVLRGTRVFVGTTTALNASLSLFKLKRFDLAIVDEASQILEPHIIGLLSACHGGGCAIRKCVFIGDHKQLPAVVQQNRRESVVDEPELRAVGLTDCRNSLFQRLFEAYGTDPRYAYMLTRQGRMHHDIAVFPNRVFYDGRLREIPLAHQLEVLPQGGVGENGIDNLLATRRMAFVSVKKDGRDGSDKVNQSEADVIAAAVYRIYLRHHTDFNPSMVGVIVPYRNQIATVRNTIERRYAVSALRGITIDTVERFQGSQRDYIIYGFTVSRPYQLDFLTDANFTDTSGNEIDRKLNVAMTRARLHLLLVGDADLLARNDVYNRLIGYARSCGAFLMLTVPPLSRDSSLFHLAL